MLKNNTLLKRFFIFFLSFSLGILFLVWLFNIVFIDYYYESYKTKDLSKSLNEIKNTYNPNDSKNEELIKLITTYSYERGICSEIFYNYLSFYSTNPLNRSCLSTFNNNQDFVKKRSDFFNSDDRTIKLTILSNNKNKTLVYGYKLDRTYTIFINTSIEPIDSTVSIIKSQFITITIIVILISSLLAYLFAKKLSKPICNLTNNARKLSKGNFNIDFSTNTNIIEIDELSKTLNNSKDILKKNDELRRDLMANVTHDLKTPLTMIKCYSEKIKDFSYKDKDKMDKDLDIIIEEVDRLTVLVNDILDLSKLESNIEELNIEKVNISSLTDQIINHFNIYSEISNYKFFKFYKDDIIIKADLKKLEQVIYNLIGNAINYATKRKEIYITIIDYKDKIKMFITDTGPGIKKEEINNIWDKYYKADKNHKRNTIGTGLGLSIVKQILDLHSSKYYVYSKEDLGTTFSFEIKK